MAPRTPPAWRAQLPTSVPDHPWAPKHAGQHAALLADIENMDGGAVLHRSRTKPRARVCPGLVDFGRDATLTLRRRRPRTIAGSGKGAGA